MEKTSVLVFGGGELQKSMIRECISMGLYTIVIDPDTAAVCADIASLFVSFSENEYAVAKALVLKYNVKAVLTASTDKPLLVMSKIAQEFNLLFVSEEVSLLCTDKLLMKKCFSNNDIPYARGIELENPQQMNLNYPIILKPRDNSGSRGVLLCENKIQLERLFYEVKKFSNKSSILAEEYIDGKEYSVEALHSKEKTLIVQITEKKTTSFPYNVELGHFQPANISSKLKEDVYVIINKIADSFNFKYCASHTEFKISSKGIVVIETSPRLGGDYITSMLTPLSTEINIERQLINICLNQFDQNIEGSNNYVSGVEFFNLPTGVIVKIFDLSIINKIKGVKYFNLALSVGDYISPFSSSLDRYGCVIIQKETKSDYLKTLSKVNYIINSNIIIK